MGNTKFTVRYDGRPFFGWQRHNDKPTVQGTLEDALSDVEGCPVLVTGSGRTDRGAHAEGQVFNAVVGRSVRSIVEELNSRLPSTIRILDAEPVADDFHARQSASGKVYRYEIHNEVECPPDKQGRVWHIPGELDVDRMRKACPLFVGELDFASFATKSNFKLASTTRDLRRVELEHNGPRISLVFEADGFLYKMVRNLVRAIVKVGEGRTSLAKLREIIEAKNRSAAPGTAPASGLFLDAVLYPQGEPSPSSVSLRARRARTRG